MIQISDKSAKKIVDQLGARIGDSLDRAHEIVYLNFALGFHFIFIGRTQEGHQILKDGSGLHIYPEWEPQIKAAMGGRHAYWRTLLMAMYLNAIKKQHVSHKSLAWAEGVDPMLIKGIQYVNSNFVPSDCMALRLHFDLEMETGQAVPYSGAGLVVGIHQQTLGQ